MMTNIMRAMLPIILAALTGGGLSVEACPWCSPVAITFDEEIKNANAAAFAQLVALAEEPDDEDASASSFGRAGSPPRAKFEVLEVIKGEKYVEVKEQVELVYFGEGPIGKKFLITGLDAPEIAWATPIALSDRAQEYVRQVAALPEANHERLLFFQKHFEDEDELLSRDAYDEFARAPYDDLKMIRDEMRPEQLTEWIQDTNIPATRRRLYMTMLGLCGSRDHADMLEGLIRSDNRKVKAGLDAMIACYITLVGEEGLPLIEDLFLKNNDAEYTDTYAAIMALRFHASQADILTPERVVTSLRYMLDRPELADLVIPDLARYKDWTALSRLVELFKQADEGSSWVRVPVIQYLYGCPLPEAKVALEELEKLDPEAFKRANTFRAAAAPSQSPEPDEGTETAGEPAAEDEQRSDAADTAPAIGATDESVADESLVADESPVADESLTDEAATEPSTASSDAAVPPVLAATDAQVSKSPGLITILGVPLGIGVGLFGLMWLILYRPERYLSA